MNDNEPIADRYPKTKRVDLDDASTGLKSWLIKLLVYPLDQGTLTLNGSALVYNVCSRRYQVRVDIPNMLLNQAECEHQF